MSIVGKSEVRVDAFDKATGRTKYYEDRMPSGALYARIKHSEIAHGYVKSIDTSAAEADRGRREGSDVLRRAGHCRSRQQVTRGRMDPGHQDTADRHLLNRHVRYYGDEVAVVIAENEVAAMQGVRALKVEYEDAAVRAGCAEGDGAGRAADSRGMPRTTSSSTRPWQRATTTEAIKGAGPDQGRGLVRNPDGAALPYRKPRLLRL